MKTQTEQWMDKAVELADRLTETGKKLDRAKELCAFYESRLKPDFGDGTKYEDEIDRLLAELTDMFEALLTQEMAEADPQAAKRKGYYEQATKLRRAAIAKVSGRVKERAA
jgi:hypothetical protein